MSATKTASKRGTGISFTFVFAVLMILHFTNPSYQKHIAKAGNSAQSVSYDDRFNFFYPTSSKEYHDYFIFSTSDGASGKTFGILGMVF